MSIRQVQSLKKKLQKYKKFHQYYKNFMNSLFEKGYVREFTADIKPNDSWYTPPHGVYHPNKKDKIRVVYECSSEFQGRSLNNNLSVVQI